MSRRSSLRLDWRHGNIRNLRAAYERACRVIPKGPHEWRMIDAGDRHIRVLIHNPQRHSDRAIFYFHGGGWIVGSPATHADISENLADTTGLPVISIDYRLAPEFKADAAISDGLAVLSHFLEREYKSAILCGDSAGGTLALAVERRASNFHRKILGVASFYGCFGLAANPALQLSPRRVDGLDAASICRYWLAANASSGCSPYSLSALAHDASCPVHLIIAGRDPLRLDSITLARALREKGRPVTVDLHRFENHSFLQSATARRAKQSAFQNLIDWISVLDAAKIQLAAEGNR